MLLDKGKRTHLLLKIVFLPRTASVPCNILVLLVVSGLYFPFRVKSVNLYGNNAWLMGWESGQTPGADLPQHDAFYYMKNHL